ncbi:unnamed protein product [Nippostrongylus brasiliensis]|uniref:Nucleolin_bd domain-containing protein n=1 Tax=Nippostrongylus brasiliensis TaxID=27835 RepID=A0A0N4XM07_NIPBR|nr:unnamed protein product [Nippostrongylus brasiliensis]
MENKSVGGFVSDPQLLPRIKEHCLNFPDQKFFRAEDVAFDLQRKYYEYGRKKYKPFVAIVREGLHRLNIRDKPDVPVQEVIKLDGKEDVKKDAESGKPRGDRKRKAERTTAPQKVEEVCISSGDEEYKNTDNIKDTNRANKSILNLYNGGKKTEDTSNTNTVASSKKKKSAGARAPISSSVESSSALRGLGSVQPLNVQPRPSSVTFESLGGCDRQFLEVCRLAMHMKRPQTYKMLGVDPPKGFLVHGPPGCGKTLFAQVLLHSICDFFDFLCSK